MTRRTFTWRHATKSLFLTFAFFLFFLIKSYAEGHIENYVMNLSITNFVPSITILFSLFMVFVFILLFEGLFEETLMNIFEKLFGKKDISDTRNSDL